MSASSIILMVVHIGIFFVVKTRISKRKRELERENAVLKNDLEKSRSNEAYYKKIVEKR